MEFFVSFSRSKVSTTKPLAFPNYYHPLDLSSALALSLPSAAAFFNLPFSRMSCPGRNSPPLVLPPQPQPQLRGSADFFPLREDLTPPDALPALRGLFPPPLPPMPPTTSSLASTIVPSSDTANTSTPN